MAKQYNSAQQQVTETGTELARKLETSLAMPTAIKSNLIQGGLSPDDIGVISAACVATGVSPLVLQHAHNVAPMIRIMDLMRNYGYIPGEDFHVAIYKAKAKLPDETGLPTDVPAQLPTVVVMLSAARTMANMDEHGRLSGKTYHISTKEITGDEARKIFTQDVPGGVYAEGKTRVVRATLKTFLRNGVPLDEPGEAPVFYGFYSPSKKDRQGNTVGDWLEESKTKDNYSPVDIATKRAQAKAARYATRTNYSRDNRPVDVRMAALIDSASNKVAALEQVGSLQDAFDDGEEHIDSAVVKEKEHPQLTAMPVNNSKSEVFIDVEEGSGAKRVKTVGIRGHADLDNLFELEDMPEIDFDTGVIESSPATRIQSLFSLLDREMSEECVSMLYEIRVDENIVALGPDSMKTIYDIIRECGSWEADEEYEGVNKAELALRFVVGAEVDEDLATKPVRALSKRIVEKAIVKGKVINNPDYDKAYHHTMLFNVCQAMREFMEDKVLA